jgi:hypothetical protein
MTAAELAAGSVLGAAILGLIGVPLAAEITGRVTARSERLKRRARHESAALGTLIRAWIAMSQMRTRDVPPPPGLAVENRPDYVAAYVDWLTGLAEIGAFGTPESSAALARFVACGGETATLAGRNLLVDAVFAVRRGTFRRRLRPADKASIAMLLFGAQS